MRKIKGVDTICASTWETSTGPCEVKTAYPEIDSGEYWCEMKGVKRSKTVNITVSAASVILESPVLPVMEGDNVTLSCRKKQTPSNLTAELYKDGFFIRSSSTGEMIINGVSMSDEGLYKCSISGAGESAESWLNVTAGDVILESPALPVIEGETVTLTCRKMKTSLNAPADFYKNGNLIKTEYTGEITSQNISMSDEGFYKCSISQSQGESPESWLVVTERDVNSKPDPIQNTVVADPQEEKDSNVKHRSKRVIVLLLLGTQLHLSLFEDGAGFPQVDPNRQQHFAYETFTVNCEGLNGLTGWRVMRKLKGVDTICASTWETSTGPCEIKTAYPGIDSGEYWCEIKGVKISNTVNITVSAASVILESPVLPVMEGDDVTLRCRKKQTPSNLTAEFYKDGVFIRSSSTGEMIIHNVSMSDEGLYKCSISGAGESAESWLTVTGGDVILESPALPVMEGETATLTCRKQGTSSKFPADFYKNGNLIKTEYTGEMTIHNISMSDEGFYKCSISGSQAESPESWLAVTGS
ncbi:Fc receptor-like protein 5 [Anabas testudineus]|uniref:Fc receptor-like protein 5 n=1 Tax=Anabas testudineus TaxID=64144 RepID=UPI00143D3677|nr:Fc receptor-like protein 5 [Anabas testudineus]